MTQRPNELDAWWMPFTANRAFKHRPRMIDAAKNMHYIASDGRRILDGTAGLWCCNAGHAREPIISAIREQAGHLDYAPPFQFGHEAAFTLANWLAALAPAALDHVFFCNSGSEAVDTALKIALAYRSATGEPSRACFVGRERGYHGVGFGGLSVGGIEANRQPFAARLPDVIHLPHTYDREHQRFTRGEPDWGAHLANCLETIIEGRGVASVNAVIIEPMAGSTGVLPPPKGYLRRLRDICDRHGVLLIFDEVITGFGRLGYAFAAERYDVVPDMICFAKGVTSGAVPMGGVIVSDTIHAALMTGPEQRIEFPHGYTYSAHPLACAAALATLDLYRDENLFRRTLEHEARFGDALMSLRDEPHVLDLRSVGLCGAIDLDADPTRPGQRGFQAMVNAFEEHDVVIRVTGDTIALTPPLIITTEQIDELIEKVRRTIRSLD